MRDCDCDLDEQVESATEHVVNVQEEDNSLASIKHTKKYLHSFMHQLQEAASALDASLKNQVERIEKAIEDDTVADLSSFHETQQLLGGIISFCAILEPMHKIFVRRLLAECASGAGINPAVLKELYGAQAHRGMADAISEIRFEDLFRNLEQAEH